VSRRKLSQDSDVGGRRGGADVPPLWMGSIRAFPESNGNFRSGHHDGLERGNSVCDCRRVSNGGHKWVGRDAVATRGCVAICVRISGLHC